LTLVEAAENRPFLVGDYVEVNDTMGVRRLINAVVERGGVFPNEIYLEDGIGFFTSFQLRHVDT